MTSDLQVARSSLGCGRGLSLNSAISGTIAATGWSSLWCGGLVRLVSGGGRGYNGGTLSEPVPEQMGEGMRKNGVAMVLLAVSLGLPLAACQDTKARQENEQLKGQLTDLQKQNADLSGRVDALARENSDLSAENEKLKAQIPHKKSAAKSSKKRKHRSTSSS